MSKKTLYKIEDWNTFEDKPKRTVEYETTSRDEAASKFIDEYYPGEDVKSVRYGLKIIYVSGYNDETKTTRCTQCGSEFSDNEIEEKTACPECGSTGVPMAISEDVEVKINWHELRILSIWAENWGRQCDKQEEDESKKTNLYTVMSIAERLQKQFPDKTPLTLFSEVRDLRKSYDIETDIDNDSFLNL